MDVNESMSNDGEEEKKKTIIISNSCVQVLSEYLWCLKFLL